MTDATLDIEAGLAAFGPRARSAFEAAATEQELRNARAEIMGKKGELTAILRSLGQQPADKRRANSVSTPFNSAKLTFSPTRKPSIWWNIGECVTSSSRRKTLPPLTIAMGGVWVLISRTCTLLVWVRSNTRASGLPPSTFTQKLSCMSVAG